MSDILSQLKKPISDKVKNYMVSYLCAKMNCFVYVGVNLHQSKQAKTAESNEAIAESPREAASALTGNKQVRNANEVIETLEDILIPETNEITLKFREKAKGENSDTLLSGQADSGRGSRREKERKIGEVVIKVSAWRRLYNEHKVTLETAAEKVGISKKSLDDYFL